MSAIAAEKEIRIDSYCLLRAAIEYDKLCKPLSLSLGISMVAKSAVPVLEFGIFSVKIELLEPRLKEYLDVCLPLCPVEEYVIQAASVCGADELDNMLGPVVCIYIYIPLSFSREREREKEREPYSSMDIICLTLPPTFPRKVILPRMNTSPRHGYSLVHNLLQQHRVNDL